MESGVNRQSNTVSADPFQEIDRMESYVSFEEHQQYLSADREHEKCFFAWNGLKGGKEKGLSMTLIA